MSNDKDKQEQQAVPSMEQQLQARIRGAVSFEVDRLEKLAADAKLADKTEAYCHALESVASIKARAEVYCVQVEMAAKTAAMASVFSGMARGQESEGAPKTPGRGDIGDLVNKAKGGRGEQGEPPKDDQADGE